VVLVGSPASGKSYVARRSGLRVISRDDEGRGFWRALAAAVGQGESFIVDATNPKRADRARLAAMFHNFEFEVWHVATPKAICIHLNAARCQLGERHVPAVAIHTYWARLEPPDAGEDTDLGYTLQEIPFALALDAPPEITSFRYCA
jgi:predicted kinase